MALPSNNKAVGDSGHTEDHNAIVDEINIIKNTYLPVSASSNYLTISSSSNFLPVSASSGFLPTSASSNFLPVSASTTLVSSITSIIVDSAPSTLDTLNELAAALGDDANYAASTASAIGQRLTISNASATYLPISASSNFLPTSASSNYLPISASSDYLRVDTASATYLRQDTASASYLQISASSNYLPASASSSYGLKSGTLSQFAETTSSQLAGVISDETGSGSLVFGTSPTLSTPIMLSPEERCNIVSTAASGTINFNILTSTIWFYTNNATADHTLNFRGDAGNTLNSLLAIGDSISLIWLNTNGSSAFRPTAFQIDGASITPIWSGGAAPTTGNANSIDAYSFSIIKTAATPTYTVLAGQARFA